MNDLPEIPFWVVLSAVGAIGSSARYQRSAGVKRVDLITFVALGAILGPSVTLGCVSVCAGQMIAIGQPAQVVLALCVGGAAVYLFDRFSKLVERSGDRAADVADKRIGDKLTGGDPAEGKKP